jgi:GH15 family glucan-1,4-alpha-glucosidase
MPIRARRASEQALAKLLALAPVASHSQRATIEREIGNDVSAAHRIDRIITCEHGETTLDITLKLTPDYARSAARITLHVEHPNAVSAIIQSDGQFFVFVAKPMPGYEHVIEAPTTRVLDGRLQASWRMFAGQRISAALNFARDQREAEALLQRLWLHDLDDDAAETLDYWQTWADVCDYQGPYADAVLRSALALKLCVFEPTGAIVAAPTTSLPEDIGGERNWDYRYTWLRDSSFTLQALGNLGYHGEARDYFHFLHDLHLLHGDQFCVLYTLHGESADVAAERDLKHLEGYRGSRPVRIGNGAATQRQMDIYGELADAALLYAEALGFCAGARARESPRDLRELASVLADFVTDHWQDLDRGIWEVRGPERPFVYSRVMCWVTLDRALRLTEHHANSERRTHWKDASERIRADLLAHGYSYALQTFTQAYGVDAVDAANFRIALVGYLPPSDERLRSTIATTGRILQSDEALIYRYRPAATEPARDEGATTDDGLEGAEGAFLVCAFWYVSNLALMGEVEEARRRFECLLAYTSPLGLFSEEVDPTSGALLGNFPQAFTHIGLINAANHLRRAEERAQRQAESAPPA